MKTVVGLTGMSGAGKTTVSDRFSKAGYYIINCDKTARDATKKGSPLLARLSDEFGADVINSDGTLNRSLLADKAFGNPERTQMLNKIMLPYIFELIENEINSAENNLILLDAPTLFQAGADKLCTHTVAVVADRDICVKRIMLRDNLTESQANARLDSQFSADYFVKNCTYLINNDSVLSDLQIKADEIIKNIKMKGDNNVR